MNIALFASAFYPSLGGVEELVRQLAHSLIDAGHHVVVLTNCWPRTLPEYELVENIPVYRLAFRVPTGHWRANLSYLLTNKMIQRRTQRILREHRIDVIHVQCVSGQALYAARAAEAMTLPFVVTLQGELTMDAAGIFSQEGIGRDIFRRCMRHADAITACSGHTLIEAENFMGQPFGTRGSVIYNGIRMADFKSAKPHVHRRPYFLAIGRHVPQKGFDLLLRAWAKVVNNVPDLDLILAGDGPSRADLESLAKELELQDRVSFFGRADRAQAASLFAGCQFFVLPSRHEPFGIVNLEAMACGKPVIAARVGGVPEFVLDGKTGLLVTGEQVDEFASAILKMATDTALREQMGAACLQYVCQFDWQQLTQKYDMIYNFLLCKQSK